MADGMLIDIPQTFFDELEKRGKSLIETLEEDRAKEKEYENNLIHEDETVKITPAKYNTKFARDYELLGAAIFKGGVKVLLDEYKKFKKAEDYATGGRFKDKLSNNIENKITVNVEKDKENKDSNWVKALGIIVALLALAAGLWSGTGTVGQGIESFGTFIRGIKRNLNETELRLKKLKNYRFDQKIKNFGNKISNFVKNTNKKLSKVFRLDKLTEVSNEIKTLAKENVYNKSVGKLVSKISLIKNIFKTNLPKITNIISSVFKELGKLGNILVELGKDLTKLGVSKLKTSSLVKGVSKITALPKFLGKFVGNIGGKLLRVFKFLPAISTFLGLYQAYLRYEKGEYIKGTIELLAAVAGILPGPGWIASIGLNLLLGMLDSGTLTGGGIISAAGKMIGTGLRMVKGIFKNLAKWFGSKLAKVFGKGVGKRIPFIGPLFSFGFAIYDFIEGKYTSGIFNLVSGLVGLLDYVVPGLGTALAIGVDLLNWLCTDEGETAKSMRQNISSWFDNVTNWIKESATKFCTWIGNWVSETWASITEWFNETTDTISNFISEQWEGTKNNFINVCNYFSQLGETFKQTISNAVTNTFDAIKNAINETVKSAFKIKDAISEFINSSYNKLVKFINEYVIDKLNTLPMINIEHIETEKVTKVQDERLKNTTKEEVTKLAAKQIKIKNSSDERIKKFDDKMSSKQGETNMLLAKMCDILQNKDFTNVFNTSNISVNGQRHSASDISNSDPRYGYI